MKRTISIKLQPSAEQHDQLVKVQEAFSRACNLIVPYAINNRCWNRVALHHLTYYPVQEQTALGSQMLCNAIKSVADAYKAIKPNKKEPVPEIVFKPTGSVHYDKRTYSIKGELLSLWTLRGRIKVNMQPGAFQSDYLTAGSPQEAELCRRGKTFYFNVVLDLPDVPANGSGVMGVDVGENNLAATSTGKLFGGGQLCFDRDRFLALRRRVQSNGSQSARQLLGAISGREQRQVRHVNHVTSRHIVNEAQAFGVGMIVLEDLTGIRSRIKAGLRVRTRVHRWAFRQLQTFIQYKAEAAGIHVLYVNPAYSSQTCSICGAIGQRNKHRFTCDCGSRAHSDTNSARNLALLGGSADAPRALVTAPDVGNSIRFAP